MAELAKQIGIFMMALIIIGIPFLDGLFIDSKNGVAVFTVFSAIDFVIVVVLINHCI